MIQFELFEDKRSWSRSADCVVSGSAFVDGELLNSQQIIEKIDEYKSSEGIIGLQKLQQQMTGHFAYASELEDGSLVVGADLVRSIPLFFGQEQSDRPIAVTNSPEELIKKWGSSDNDSVSEAEFRLGGYVTGSYTLDKRIFQNRAGKLLIVKPGREQLEQRVVSVHDFLPESNQSTSENQLLEELDQAWLKCVDRLIQYASGRQIVIPLSGGFDSRLVLVSLKEKGYENICTFTYGKADLAEAELSRQIAATVGVKWLFEPYSTKGWQSWSGQTETQELFAYARKAVSSPHIQDALALKKLSQKKLIDDNAVFAPGHSGDFVAGSHIPRLFLNLGTVNTKTFLKHFWARHYNYWNKRKFPATVLDGIKNRILQLTEYGDSTSEAAIALHDKWDLEERQAKHIVNSVRNYEFYGYDWWLPMWDNDFVKFWTRVPQHLRVGEQLYRQYVIRKYAALTGMEDKNASVSANNHLGARLRQFVYRLPGMTGIAKKVFDQLKKRREYANHKFLWYGIIPEHDFNRRYTGRENINSFVSDLTIETFKSLNRTGQRQEVE